MKIFTAMLFLTLFARASYAQGGGGTGTLVTTPLPTPTSIPITPMFIKGGYYGPTKVVVKLDPISRIPIGNIPFDRNFIIRLYLNLPKDAPTEIYLTSHRHKKTNVTEAVTYYLINRADYDASDANLKLFPNAIDIIMPALLPNINYSLDFVSNSPTLSIVQNAQQVFKLLYDNKPADAATLNVAFRTNYVNSNNPAIQELTDYYNQQNVKTIFDKYHGDAAASAGDITNLINTHQSIKDANGADVFIFSYITTLRNLSTQQYTVEASSKLSIVAEGGLVFTGFQKGFNTVTPYVGINYSFRPLDSDIPFSYLVHSQRIKFIQRFTVNLGLTLNSLAKTNYRGDLFGSNNVMAGFGYKFSHVISITGGGLFYNNLDPNPLLSKKTLGVAPYFGISINLKIKDALGDLAKVFTYGK